VLEGSKRWLQTCVIVVLVGLLLGNKSRLAGAILIGIAVLGVIFVYVLRDFVWSKDDDA